MQRILVPLDGSRLAEQALPSACALARCLEAELRLLHVIEVLEALEVLETADRSWSRTTVRTEAASYLEHTATERCEGSSRPVLTQVAEGTPAAAIQAEAEAWNADLIVMTTQGRGAFGRALLGSVADAVLRNSSVPVVLIRADEEAPTTEVAGFEHVLVPLDGSALAEQAIEPAARIAQCSNARLTLLRVLQPLVASVELMGPRGSAYAQADQPDQTPSREYLTRMSQSLESKVDRVETELVFARFSAPAEILDYSKNNGVDLIALSTRGSSGLKRFVLGSVADKLIRAAPTPVLVVPPK